MAGGAKELDWCRLSTQTLQMSRPRVHTVISHHHPEPGDRVFVRCEGGPCTSRLVDWPVPLEIEDRGGLYVLDDHGGLDEWAYLWVDAQS